MSCSVEAILSYSGGKGSLTYGGPLTPYTVETLVSLTRGRGNADSITLVLAGDDDTLTDRDAESLVARFRAKGCAVTVSCQRNRARGFGVSTASR